MKCPAPVVRQWSVVGLALVCCCAAPAEAVVVAVTNLDVTAVAPAENPFWSNVAQLGSASAVYLGNRWMITANHVGGSNAKFADGSAFAMTVGSSVQLSNDGVAAFGSPDLRMFRLAQDPGRPALEIGTTTPSAGANVMMIGAGRDRLPGLIGWSISGFGQNLVWNVVPLPQADALGYLLDSTKTMRWGTNRVIGELVINNSTAGFSTGFDRPGTSFEAQAVSGDSGGGVFQSDDGNWRLVGIMATQQTSTGQPSDAVVFGNQSQSADLSAYRDQIVEMISRPDPPWQNQINYFDVDRSGFVSAIDLVLVVNDLIVSGIHDLDGLPSAGSPLLDVSGDNLVSALDSVQIINALIGGTANPTATLVAGPSNVRFVPEPASGVLLCIGVLVAGVACRVARFRRLTCRRRQRRQLARSSDYAETS